MQYGRSINSDMYMCIGSPHHSFTKMDLCIHLSINLMIHQFIHLPFYSHTHALSIHASTLWSIHPLTMSSIPSLTFLAIHLTIYVHTKQSIHSSIYSPIQWFPNSFINSLSYLYVDPLENQSTYSVSHSFT